MIKHGISDEKNPTARIYPDTLRMFVRRLKPGLKVRFHSAYGTGGESFGEIISVHKYLCVVKFPATVTGFNGYRKDVTRKESFTNVQLMIWNMGREI